MISIPKEKTIKLSDIDRFIIGLKELSIECNLKTITYSGFGIQNLEFEDGSNGGLIAIFKEAGILKK